MNSSLSGEGTGVGSGVAVASAVDALGALLGALLGAATEGDADAEAAGPAHAAMIGARAAKAPTLAICSSSILRVMRRSSM
jgi:hypothetical protein